MNNLKVGTRLSFLSAIGLLVLVLVGSVGVYGLGKTVETVDGIYSHNLKSLEAWEEF